MDRQFATPFGGHQFGGHHEFEDEFGFFNPFFNPFFPRRRLFPFFFISPFFFPFFFRDGEDRNNIYHSHHKCVDGDTMASVAAQYNVPQPILEEVNPQTQYAGGLSPGATVGIPRMNMMYCQKMYKEHAAAENVMPGMLPMYTSPAYHVPMNQSPAHQTPVYTSPAYQPQQPIYPGPASKK